LGVLLGFAGIAFIIYSSSLEKGETITGSLIGNLGVMIAMFGWLSYVLLSKKFSRYFSPVEIGSTSVLVTLPVAFMLFMIQLGLEQPTIILSNRLLAISLYIGFFGTFLTYILLQYAIKVLSPLTVNLSSYVQPMTVALLAVIFLGEKMTWSFLFGGSLVFLGVFLTATLEFYRRRK
jgi:drug/metabolite transporter (DMT)-like permease